MQIQIQIHNCKLLFYIQTQVTNIHFTWVCALCSPGYNATQLPAFGCGIEAVERTLRTFFFTLWTFFGPFGLFRTFWTFSDRLDIFWTLRTWHQCNDHHMTLNLLVTNILNPLNLPDTCLSSSQRHKAWYPAPFDPSGWK